MKDRQVHGGWADTLPSQWGPVPGEIEVPLGVAPTEPGSLSAAAPRVLAGAGHLPLWSWMHEGLRAALFAAPRTGAAAPSPWQVVVLTLLSAMLLVAVARLEVAGPAQFDLRGWLIPYWTTLVLLWLAWWAMAPAHRPQSAAPRRDHPSPSGGLAAWFVLSTWAPLVPTLLLYGLLGWAVQRPQTWQSEAARWVMWGLYIALFAWLLAAVVVVSARFIRSRARTAVFTAGLAGVAAFGTWQFPDRPWELDARALAATQGAEPQPARLHLSQAVFEGQQALWRQQAQALVAERAGVVDVYGLVFAPYASEEVFRRESTMVSTLLQQRFDASGRVLHLLNHAETAGTHLWATPENLQRAIEVLGERMDREHDVLVIYMTSHGARDHALAASHWPLEVPPVTPEMLRAALDAAGIRHRVIAVSACYSGGWIEPLATEGSLIMTAADATHTSYGCGTRSELTFFGRAVFNEQLRNTRSFIDAFAKAVPLIQQREVEAGKADGFSNPQIRVGTEIGPVLKALEQRLEAQAAADSAAEVAEAAAAGGVRP